MTHPRRWRLLLPVCLLLGLAGTMLAGPENKAQYTIAGILVKLNHFPNDADKTSLKGVVEDKASSTHEKVVAQALMNVQHKVTADDRAKLDELLKDKTAPESVKTLATIIVNLNHAPSDADKETLKKFGVLAPK